MPTAIVPRRYDWLGKQIVEASDDFVELTHRSLLHKSSRRYAYPEIRAAPIRTRGGDRGWNDVASTAVVIGCSAFVLAVFLLGRHSAAGAALLSSALALLLIAAFAYLVGLRPHDWVGYLDKDGNNAFYLRLPEDEEVLEYIQDRLARAPDYSGSQPAAAEPHRSASATLAVGELSPQRDSDSDVPDSWGDLQSAVDESGNERLPAAVVPRPYDWLGSEVISAHDDRIVCSYANLVRSFHRSYRYCDLRPTPFRWRGGDHGWSGLASTFLVLFIVALGFSSFLGRFGLAAAGLALWCAATAFILRLWPRDWMAFQDTAGNHAFSLRLDTGADLADYLVDRLGKAAESAGESPPLPGA